MRKLMLALLPLALAGCAISPTTTLQQPGTGATATCSGVLPDINLWSQYNMCVESYVTEGYVVQK